jgi:branched-subunit amino acid transport protein
MTLWLTIIGAGLLTYAIRLSFIVLLGRMNAQRAEMLRRGLRFVPAAVLSAIIFSEVLLRDRQLYLALGNTRLWAGLFAAVVAWRTKNILLTIVAGMGALWLIQARLWF